MATAAPFNSDFTSNRMQKSGASAEKASAGVPAPSTTAFMNLSDYMYQAYDTSYASTGLEQDIGFTPLLRRSGAPVVSIDNANGLYAQAFVSTAPGPKQIIIAYEGTQLTPVQGTSDPNVFAQGKEFTPAQIQDDLQLYLGKEADSLKGSASFARRVEALAAHDHISKHNVYITGHSLGAAEAAYAASKTGISAVTFAAPGINSAFTGHRTANITNYVDAGDPIGNYAADGQNVLAPVLVSDHIKHSGSVVVLPNATGQQGLQQDAQLYASGSPLFQDLALKNALENNGQYHHLTTYASDLGVTLYLSDNTVNSESGFFPQIGTSGQSAKIDTSYIAAGLTGGGLQQVGSTNTSGGSASTIAATDATRALGIKAHHAG